MDINLQPAVERFIEDQVKSGRFASVDQVVNAAVSTMSRDADLLENLSTEAQVALRKELDIGIAEADRGEFAEFSAEDIIAEGRKLLAAKKKKAS